MQLTIPSREKLSFGCYAEKNKNRREARESDEIGPKGLLLFSRPEIRLFPHRRKIRKQTQSKTIRHPDSRTRWEVFLSQGFSRVPEQSPKSLGSLLSRH